MATTTDLGTLPAEPVVNVTDSEINLGQVAESLPILVKEAKAGWRTTEFWITLLTGLGVSLEAIPVPDNIKAVLITVSAVAYVLSRGLAKKGVGNEVVVDDASKGV